MGMMPGKRRMLGEVLLEEGLITREDLDRALTVAAREGVQLGRVLLEQHLVAEADLMQAVSRQQGYPVVDLRQERLDPAALRLVPEAVARQLQVLPLRLEGQTLVLAAFDPARPGLASQLAVVARRPLRFVLAPPTDLALAIEAGYRGVVDLARHLGTVGEGADSPVARTLDLILEEARKVGASDVHLEPQESSLRVRYRVDGVLRDASPLPPDYAAALASRVKVLARLDIVEHARPQDGQFFHLVDDAEVDVRVSVIGTVWGEKVVLRLLDRSRPLLQLSELGFSVADAERYAQVVHRPFGMVLACGPTGSGKSTTLYATVNALDRVGKNIVTLEEPVEYTFPGIVQIPVSPRAGLTFAAGLRAVLRQDPDVILVGEVRDTETAQIAVQAALTGHLVLSSVHATDAVGALVRLVDAGVEAYLVAAAVTGVVSQRLVRRICPHCRREITLSDQEQTFYREQGGREGVTFYRGAGCNLCGRTGYAGRVGIYELLILDEELRRAVVAGESVARVRELAQAAGMTPLRRAALAKVEEGVTTVEEVLRAVYA